MIKKLTSLFLFSALLLCSCGNVRMDEAQTLSVEEAKTETDALLRKIKVKTVTNPEMDIYADETSVADTLASIDTFPLVVEGDGDVNIEIAAATEMSSSAPDDWLVEVAKRFNDSAKTVDGKRMSVSVRKITSGEVVTYMTAGAYHPDVYIPSNDAWGQMLTASGIKIEKMHDRIIGNTAGILIKKDVYDKFTEKYGEATVKTVIEAANAGDLTFAYTNPYTSSTGLNILTAMLKAFDEENPLSDKAQQSLLDYQKTSPPVAYTTAVLRNQASKGIINAMVMEEQAYINTPELKDYVYIPAGIRHDHPYYYCGSDKETDDKKECAKSFADFCLEEAQQKLADEKGFNRHDDYVGEDSGLDGNDYLAVQKVWKKNKTGGKPIVAVFVADVSGSMDGEPLNQLKSSLINSSTYIGEDNSIGLVSYSNNVTINLPIERFDAKQRAYFSGEVKALSAGGGTATYDAVIVALDMLQRKMEETPDAKPMLFVLTDGDTNTGYELKRVKPIVAGLGVPVYSIAYNYSNTDELQQLTDINEAALIKADSADIPNQLRNLFNVAI